MLKLSLRTLVQMTVALAPFAWTIARFKDDKEAPWLPIILTAAAMIFAFFMDVFDLFIPHVSVARFRDDYLRAQLAIWEKNFDAKGIRFNIMYVRRRWFWLFFRFFQWDANLGFDPANEWHHDLKLWLHVKQGVCGRAFSTNRIVFAETDNTSIKWRPWPQGPYRLWSWQIKKVQTVGVKAILSIPMWRTIGTTNNPHYQPVGVINIDATTAEAAVLLKKNKERISSYFADEGKLLAFLPSR
jgi:hypothetical protein